MNVRVALAIALACSAVCPSACAAAERGKNGDGRVAITGELRQWHKVTLTLDGPFADERDDSPNPFVDLRMTVTFTHESGTLRYIVPGYFAADGNAANTSAHSGTKWRAHLSPDKTGKWTYRVAFVRGKQAAVDSTVKGAALKLYHGRTGSFTIKPSDKTGRDLRGEGRLQYVGKHYLRFAGSKRYFLKAGADAPETLLAYRDFDGTTTYKVPLKTWQPHVRDWKPGDPTWKGGKGKGLIGALNYLSSKGCNAFSFLTYNAGGDGDNVWPFVSRNDKRHYDCSKLDGWQIVFDHAQSRGLYLHFKMQEQENDDNRLGGRVRRVAVALDGGDLGIERKLYCRELIARFAHCLALNWNLGEENTQSAAQQRAMAKYIRDTDPYKHHIVVHTYPNRQDAIYSKLLGNQSVLTGASLQNAWNAAHRRTLHWVRASAKAGRPWVVACDEQNPPSIGVPPDPGFEGFSGKARDKNVAYDLHDIRKATLWGTLMAGGAGVEYYFGYKFPHNDLNCEDFRSRDKSWDYCRIAIGFFRDQKIPFQEMRTDNALVGNAKDDNSRFCFAKPGKVYLVYLPNGGTTNLDLTKAAGSFTVRWFNPRRGGKLLVGAQKTAAGGRRAKLGPPPADSTDDWLVVVRTR
jgi:Domain of unknown function (DUF5060)/Putative collagen-binding domain of a collagenase